MLNSIYCMGHVRCYWLYAIIYEPCYTMLCLISKYSMILYYIVLHVYRILHVTIYVLYCIITCYFPLRYGT